GSTLHVEGWAASRIGADGTDVDGVELWLDGPRGAGTWLGEATYGLPRPDIADRINNPDARLSGFTADLDIAAIEPGPHELFAIARGRPGQSASARVQISVER